MSLFEAIILGIIQGITEFLPVSSSGHLKLAQYLFNLENLNKYLIFDLICHLGTLLAIFLMFWTQIKESLTSNKSKLLQIILGTLPLFPLLLILKPIKAIFNDPSYLGICFIFTSALLYAGIKWGHVKQDSSKKPFKDSLVIGLFQSVAILPGISRSGSTISAARLLGWSPAEAINFSFLLAIPAIIGGVLVELLQLVIKNEKTFLPDISLLHYLTAFFTSFTFGYFSLLLLRKLSSKEKFMYFVWYCLILGILTTFYI